jgi:hypothetical protein
VWNFAEPAGVGARDNRIFLSVSGSDLSGALQKDHMADIAHRTQFYKKWLSTTAHISRPLKGLSSSDHDCTFSATVEW